MRYMQLLFNPFTWIADKAAEELKDGILDLLIKIEFTFCRMVYNLITKIYSVFLAIGSSQLVSNNITQAFMTRIYIVVSVVMLFLLAYSFMNMIINPDNAAKKDSSPGKIVRNVIISLLAIVFIPALFRFAYSIQNSVIKDQVINKIVLGSTNTDPEDRTNANKYGQSEFSVALFEANFYIDNPQSINCDNVENDDKLECTFSYARQLAINNADIRYFAAYREQVKDGTVTFNFLLSMVLGVFAAYVLIIYCFDIAVRAIKLFLLEIIAPVPALFFIVPGQSKVFVSWIKATLKAFAEIFLKIAILSFGLFFINSVVKSLAGGALAAQFDDFSSGVKYTAQAFIIFGVVLFIKQAPGLISDIFGIKMEKGSLNLKKKLTDSGALAALGLGLGGIYAYSGGKAGAKARGKNWFSRRMSGVASFGRGALTGARSGLKGSVKGMGAAYGEALDTQLYRAKRGGFGNAVGVFKDQLRDNLGIDSVYDEEVKLATIQTEEDLRKYKQRLRNIKEQSRQKINEITDTAKDGNGRNHQGLDTLSGVLDKNKEETFKSDSTTTIEVDLPTLVSYKAASSSIGAEVGNVLTSLGLSGTFNETDGAGIVHKKANYSSISDGISTLDRMISGYQEKPNLLRAQLESINSELAGLPKTSANASKISALEAKRASIQSEIDKIEPSIVDAQQKRKFLADALAQIEAMSDADKYQVVTTKSSINANHLQEYENNLRDMFIESGASADYAAELATIWSQKFKDSYDELLAKNATADLSGDRSKSKLIAELAKFQDIVKSDQFGKFLTESGGELHISQGIDSQLEPLITALKSKDLQSCTGEELYKMLKTLKRVVSESDFAEQEALRKGIITYEDEKGKTRRSTLSRSADETKEIEEIIKRAEEELKNKKVAYEDHKNNAAAAKRKS